MTVRFHIEDSETDEIAVHEDSYDYEAHEPMCAPGWRYQWAEGNYSCDCNRAIFHRRALDRDEINVPCTGIAGSRFRIVKVEEDGVEVDLSNYDLNEAPQALVVTLNG